VSPTQTTKWDGVAVGKDTVDVGKAVAVANGNVGKLRPPFPLAGVEFLA
jgi:hypothetical protein